MLFLNTILKSKLKAMHYRISSSVVLVSNSNIMKDFVFEERVKKLEELNKDERIKMVWMWCKQNVITLNQFKQLVSYCC